MSAAPTSSPATLPLRFVRFALWFALEVVRSARQVLADVLTPGIRTRPRVVCMPVDSVRDAHVATIGALITLTPGTLTIGVREGPTGARELVVHTMYHEDDASAVADLRDMEERMLRALTLRGRPAAGGRPAEVGP